jgi:excisionase family DNA binding protein
MAGFDYSINEDRKLDRLLTIDELCKLLNLPKSSVYYLTHQKKIPFMKICRKLRFRESVINKWLESQEVCDGDTQISKQEKR